MRKSSSTSTTSNKRTATTRWTARISSRARVTDHIAAYVQSRVARAYSDAAAYRRSLGAYEPVAPDSFRLFVRQRLPDATDRFVEDDPRKFAQGPRARCRELGTAAPSPGGDTRSMGARHAAATRRGARRDHGAGGARARRLRYRERRRRAGRCPASDLAAADRGAQLARARDRRNALDLHAEWAAAAAKDAGRNRAMLYDDSMAKA